MKSIEVILHVRSDRVATAQVPEGIPPGDHRAMVLVADAAPAPAGPLQLGRHRVGLAHSGVGLRREDIYGDDGR